MSSNLKTKEINKGGRPRLEEDGQTKAVAVSMTESEREMFDRYCAVYGLSKTEMFRHVMKVWHGKLSELAPVLDIDRVS